MICRGGKYSEEDAKVIVKQILNVVAFCHLQGVVHRDLKPEVIVTILIQLSIHDTVIYQLLILVS